MGRIRVGANQVHVGFMHYSDRIKTFSSVGMSEQGPVSYLIERIQDLFYVSFEFSSIRDALTRSVKEIFRDSGRAYKVPRVALLVNDAASNPKADLTPAAQQLSQQGIQVIALGIGNAVDRNELRIVTNGKEENIVQLSSYEELYQNLDIITQKICSVNVEILKNRVEFQRLGVNDYRYFVTNLLDLKTNYIEIEIEELQANSKVNCYYSFSIRNPVKENSGRLETYRQTTREIDASTRFVTNYYLIYVPPGQSQLYFTLESLDKISNVNLFVQEIDF